VDVAELKAALERAGVCPRDYLLPGSEAGGASARQGAWFLQYSEQGWLVGGEERGSRFLSASFPDEDAACRYLLDRLTRPDPYSVGYTLAELEERRAFTQSSLESLRPALQDGPQPVMLPRGQYVERFGADGGRFLYPAGTPLEQLSLPPDTLEPSLPALGLRIFEVAADLPTVGGVIGPWFGQPGGGVMYRLESTGSDIAQLVDQGVLAPISVTDSSVTDGR